MPVVGALVLHRNGWIPVGDVANIAMRSRDVFSTESPMLGQPTTALDPSGIQLYQLGPLGYWLLAPFVALLPWDLGVLVGGAVAASSALFLTLFAAWRMGRTVFEFTTIGLAVYVAGVGLHDLVYPLNSMMSVIWIVPAVFAVWAIHRDDLTGLPILVFSASMSAQTHLLNGAMLLLLAPIVVLVLHQVVTDPARRRRHAPTLIAAAALTTMIWAPTAIEALRDSNNLARMLTSSGTTSGIGVRWVVERVVTAIGPQPFFLDGAAGAHTAVRSAGATHLVGVLVGALGSIALLARSRRIPHVGRIMATVALLLVGAVWAGSSARFGSQIRSDVFGWMVPVGFLVWSALAIGLQALAPLERRRQLTRRLAVPALAVAMIGCSATIGASARPSRRWDGATMPTTAAFIDRLDAALPAGTYELRVGEFEGVLMVGPTIVNRFHGTDRVILLPEIPLNTSIHPPSRISTGADIDAELVITTVSTETEPLRPFVPADEPADEDAPASGPAPLVEVIAPDFEIRARLEVPR